MGTRGKWASAAAAACLVAAWATGQVLLERHAVFAMQESEPVHTRWWLLPSVESLIALAACALVAAVVVTGGRRPWAMLPAAFPLTLLLGVGDGNSLGLGWMQPFQHMFAWLRAGAVVDAAVVVAVALLLGIGLPRRRATTPLASAVLRTLPIAVIAFGYWYVGHPLPDDHDRLFIARSLLLVLAAAVIATLELPLAVRALTLFVLPFADPTMSDGLIGGYTNWSTYLDHVGVGAATMTYVLGAPYVVMKLRRIKPATVSPAG